MKKSNKIVLLLFTTLVANSYICAKEKVEKASSFEVMHKNSIEMPMANDESEDAFLVPNAPILKPANIITLRAIGLGVAPQDTLSRAQEIALAKRSAIIDAYRQLGEKLHGLHITARETVRDAILQNSTIRTQLRSIIRGAEVQETQFANGLCQVEMTVKIDGKRWYKVLTGAQ